MHRSEREAAEMSGLLETVTTVQTHFKPRVRTNFYIFEMLLHIDEGYRACDVVDFEYASFSEVCRIPIIYICDQARIDIVEYKGRGRNTESTEEQCK